MRPLSKVALGGGVASLVTVGGLVAAGVLATTATLVVTDPLTPAASADSLRRFDSCAELLDWYVDHGVREIGPYGWGGPMLYVTRDSVGGELDARLPELAPGVAGTKAEAQTSSATGTNTQEADVDEPDLAKTDGRRVVRLVDQRTLVVTDVTGPQPRELGRTPLPIDVYGGELLLSGDHAIVSSTGSWGWSGPGSIVSDAKMPYGGSGGSRVIDVDISDPAHPRITHDDTYTGALVSMRLYGDTVRLVTSTPRPQLAWSMPHDRTTGGLSPREATERNRELVRRTTIEDWLPAVIDNQDPRSPAGLLDCSDVYHPRTWSGGETTAVTTYRVGRPEDRSSVGVTADGQVVYSSAARLYVASTETDPPAGWGRMNGPMVDSVPSGAPAVTTRLHAFALEDDSTTYLGSGHVEGAVRDRWSLDEHDGRLRVAWTQDRSGGVTDRNGEFRQRTRNGITILSERDGALVPTGQIAGLGIDENIQSVRWYDDLAVLVTFRQMDPLYTIDLTDQDHPREIGSLKIAGYSGYLHPIGGDQLLGLGIDATDEGRSLGAQVAVFDIADLADPQRTSRQGFGPESSLPALDDPRGFTWLPDRRTGLTTVASWSTEGSRLVALHVSGTGQLVARDLATDVGWNARTLPLQDGRVALVDDRDLRVLDVG